MKPVRHRQIREAVRLALLGAALVGVGLLQPHSSGHTVQSLWAVARESTWTELGDWPAAEASLALMLLSSGALFLILALRQLWRLWLGPRYLHWFLLVIQALPFITLIVGLYYLAKAVL